MERVCQSCGMPMSQDAKGGGTNADGSRSTEYCSFCYDNGTWMMDMTLDQMQERVGGILKKFGAPDSVQKQAVAGIPLLKRWKK
ncbi:MAG TPA: zinc ribbon domain-containing protein [Fimbriimonadaceae bacterium]|nr:zinc ribbon domain-containing protein [Fimbriimonadaceae bacterium]